MIPLSIPTDDGFMLSAHLFRPEQDNGKVLLINSATGVRQQMYFSFATFFAEQGFTVITYDYRGIGSSKPKKLKGFPASMRIWGTKDYKAMTAYLQEYFPQARKFLLGHSVGALILGMNEDSQIFEEFIFVATQKAYIGNLRFLTRVEAAIGFGFLQPLTTRFFGYFPAHRLGLGESLPKGSARDWRTLVLHPKSTNKLLEKTPDFSHQLRQKTLVVQIEDDAWVTEKGIRTLLEETYPNLRERIRMIRVAESVAGKIGHVNFFRSYNKNLWDIILRELA